MFRTAVLVVLLGCGIRTAPDVPVALLQPELLAIAISVAWLLWGPAPGAALATAAWCLLQLGWAMDDRLDVALAGRDIIVTGTVCDFPHDDGRRQRFLFTVAASPPGAELPRRLYLSSYGVLPDMPAAGQRWRLLVRLKRPRGLANPGAFDFERWALERRIGATGYVRGASLNRLESASFGHCPLTRLRRAVATAIDRAAGPRPARRFLPGIAVGARHRLTRDDWTLLRRTGTAHLMAISGLHIGLVAALMMWIGHRCAILLVSVGASIAPMAAARMFGLAGAGAYAAMAGFAVPTTRALITVAAVVLLGTLRRSIDPWQVLGFAAVAVIWVDPLAVLGSGFWLSFGAVLVLLIDALALQRPTHLPAGVRGYVRRLLSAQLCLAIGLAPVTLVFFAEVPVLSGLINLLAVPLFALLVVPLTLFGTLCLFFVPGGWILPLDWAAALVDAGLVILGPAADWPVAMWRPAIPGPGWAFAACAGAWLLCWPRPLRVRLLGAAPLAAIALGLHVPPIPALRVVIMDVGQGLAVLVQTPRHALLYDTGPTFGSRDAGEAVVLPVLRYLGVNRLDVLVLSHGDRDHIGGARSVLAAFPQTTVLATERFGLTVHSLRMCAAGLEWYWDGVRFRVLHPAGGAGGQSLGENDRSCVLSVSVAAASILLPGDGEYRAESTLVGHGSLHQHGVVVAPHHGSRTSSSPRFVAASDPEFVVFATGFANRWGFPAAAVRERWRRRGACALDTAYSGALVFEARAGDALRLVSRQRLAGKRAWTEGETPEKPCPEG